MTKFLCNSMQFRLHVESSKFDMINIACGVIRISNKCSYLEIFDQQESFKLDMIDLAYGVIRISNKCSYLEIFDQQGNPNLTPLSWKHLANPKSEIYETKNRRTLSGPGR